MVHTNQTPQPQQPAIAPAYPPPRPPPTLSNEDVYCYIDDAAVSDNNAPAVSDKMAVNDVRTEAVSMGIHAAPQLRTISEAEWSEMDFYDESILGDDYHPNPNENLYVSAVQSFRPR